MTSKAHMILTVLMVAIIATLAILLANTLSNLSTAESDKRVLESDNALQGQVIAAQAFNINRFNQVAQLAAEANATVSTRTDQKVSEYREILSNEKNCDLPVPADIADGLLSYTNSLRTSAMHADTGFVNAASNGTAATGPLTYCQAILWIQPLLAGIEAANNQLAGIRRIEQLRSYSNTSQ